MSDSSSSPKMYLIQAKAYAKVGDLRKARQVANKAKGDPHYRQQVNMIFVINHAENVLDEIVYRFMQCNFYFQVIEFKVNSHDTNSEWFEGNMNYSRPKVSSESLYQSLLMYIISNEYIDLFKLEVKQFW